MGNLYLLSLLAIILGIGACTNRNLHQYSINEFSSTLQKPLVQIVSKGYVGYDSVSDYLFRIISDKELNMLSKSEHPILRAMALREMATRPSFNHFDVIMKNLSDTAIVAADAGEFGFEYLKVSDYLVHHAKWKDSLSLIKTFEEIINRHQYLTSAFTRLTYVQLIKPYYPLIKQMVLNNSKLESGIYKIRFHELEFALYALAKYKKEEDISLIKLMLGRNIYELSELSFQLMQDYPADAYMDIYEKFYPRTFNHRICQDRNDFIGTCFVKSIAVYKNKQSARILNSILKSKPLSKCVVDTYALKESLAYAIWDNPCKAYSLMRAQIESLIKRYEKEKYIFPNSDVIIFKDTSAEPVRW